ncbi:MAG: MFS transporter [Myxococcales bacterium]|nr:MFS transporter [Myxococcales bacterium]
MSRPIAALDRLVGLEPDERGFLLRVIVVYGLVLTAYYMLRPLRDALALVGGSGRLPWLFTATFVGMLLAAPLLGWAAARLGRARLIPAVYGVCALVLVGLWIALAVGPREAATAAFFVWISIFNLVAVSLLWSVVVDRLKTAQASRLVGLVAFGGSLGAIVGPALAALVATYLVAEHLLLVAALLLVVTLVVGAPLWAADRGEGEPLGGGPLEGFGQLVRSPLLVGISLYLLLMTSTSTVVYFAQATILERSVAGDGERTTVLAAIDLAVNVLALATQGLFTGRLLRRFGLALPLASLPVVSALGLGVLGAAPTLAVVAVLQVLRRALGYAVAKPAREVLFTALPRSARYKAKGLIDTVVYRGGDAAAGWAFAGLGALGLGLGAIAWVCAPLALLWALLGWRLGASAEGGQESMSDRAGA